MDKVGTLHLLNSYHQRGFNLIPMKPRAKIPLVKWKEYRLSNEDLLRFTSQDTNWAIRCDEGFHALDFDNPERYERFVQEKGDYFSGAPVVRTGRGYHVWFKPKRAVNSFTQDGIEVKGLGSLIAIPPSIHPTGAEYQFIKPPNGKLPEIDLDSLFETPAGNDRERDNNQTSENIPSDFALRYGKSPYPQSLCGRATKVFTRGDEEMKHLVSLRCWKWHCPKCARLLKRHWMRKLGEVSFRFIIKLPTPNKPTTLLRHLDKPGMSTSLPMARAGYSLLLPKKNRYGAKLRKPVTTSWQAMFPDHQLLKILPYTSVKLFAMRMSPSIPGGR